MTRLWMALCLILATTHCALAHAFLNHATPSAGATLAVAPKQVTLEYSEALEPSFSQALVTDAHGKDVTAAPSTADGTTMQVKLKPLAPGTYRVTWHAVSVDTHRTEGSFIFVVKP